MENSFLRADADVASALFLRHDGSGGEGSKVFCRECLLMVGASQNTDGQIFICASDKRLYYRIESEGILCRTDTPVIWATLVSLDC